MTDDRSLEEQVAYLTARNESLENSVKEYVKIIFSNTNREMTMRDRFFEADGGFIADQNFDFDAGLQVTGDFVNDEKARYAQMIACTLNDYRIVRFEHDAMKQRLVEKDALIDQCLIELQNDVVRFQNAGLGLKDLATTVEKVIAEIKEKRG